MKHLYMSIVSPNYTGEKFQAMYKWIFELLASFHIILLVGQTVQHPQMAALTHQRIQKARLNWTGCSIYWKIVDKIDVHLPSYRLFPT